MPSASGLVCLLVCATLVSSCTGDSASPRLELVLEVGAPSWPEGRYRISEVPAGGVAVFDADGDGLLDIYHVRHPPPDRRDEPAPNRLYVQRRDGTFTEEPGALGLDDPGYGNGVTLGDADGDGRTDVFVANLHGDRLYLAEAGGGYRDATAAAGLADDRWSSSAAFFDCDRDGDLDLWVTSYVVDDPEPRCRVTSDDPREYCGPQHYESSPDVLWRNEGGGRFVDASSAAGFVEARSSFGVVCFDVNRDGWLDVYVANDMQPNQLYINQRDGSFADRAAVYGIALSGLGEPEAGMGVAVGDADADGRLDLLVTHLMDQTNTLYRAVSDEEFEDRSGSSGLGGPSIRRTAWGCEFVDLDLDARVDLVVVNGRVSRGPLLDGAAEGPFWNAYAEPLQLFRGEGGGKFREVTPRADEGWGIPVAGRALAVADLDRDGDLDIIATTVTGRLRVWRNGFPEKGAHWLEVRARERGRDALGAVVAIEHDQGALVRLIASSRSFQSATEPVAHFGLGDRARVDRVAVTWPDGVREVFAVGEVDRSVTLERGEGTRPAPRKR